MSRIELTIHPAYTDWGLREGVREVLQNWRDGELDGKVGGMNFDKKKGLLRVWNEGVKLPKEVLLIGFSTKRERKDLAGQFGDGLKLGCLGLVRSGCKVVIRTGDQRWEPRIELSREFEGQQVLVFRTRKCKRDEGRTTVEISGITPESWENLKKFFLFLEPPDEDQVLKCQNGSILLDRPGDIFVKDIWVAKVGGFSFGYNTDEKITDRERGMVKSFDLKWESSKMWAEVLAKGDHFLAKRVFKMLEESSQEVEYLESQTWGKAADVIMEEFEEAYGEDSVPVKDLAQSRELQLLGRKGAVVSEPLRKIIEKKKGNFYEHRAKLSGAVSKRYSADELTHEEWVVLDEVLTIVKFGIPVISLENVEVVEFTEPDLRGRFEDGRALIRRAELASLETALYVAMHEWCHASGGDGTAPFEDALLQVSVDVILKLWAQLHSRKEDGPDGQEEEHQEGEGDQGEEEGRSA